MPKDFDRCVSKGGRVRTIGAGKDKYRHVCFDNKGSHAGHTKTKKSTGGRRTK